MKMYTSFLFSSFLFLCPSYSTSAEKKQVPLSSAEFNRQLGELYDAVNKNASKKTIKKKIKALTDLTRNEDFDPNSSFLFDGPCIFYVLLHIAHEPMQKIAQTLISHKKFNPNIYNNINGETVLTYLILYGADITNNEVVLNDLIDELFQCSTLDVNQNNQDGMSPLYLALKEKNFTAGYMILTNPNLVISKKDYKKVKDDLSNLKKQLGKTTSEKGFDPMLEEKEFCNAIIEIYTTQKKKAKPKKKKSLTKSKK